MKARKPHESQCFLSMPLATAKEYKTTPFSVPRTVPDWNTYRAKPCMSSAGQVGGAVSPASLFRRNVSSKPNPLGPSWPVNLSNKYPQVCQQISLGFTVYVVLVLFQQFIHKISFLLMNSVVPIQVTETEADIVPVFWYVLSWTPHISVHTNVVQRIWTT